MNGRSHKKRGGGGCNNNPTPPHFSEADIVLQNMIFLSQKRVGVGGFGPIIGVILFVFFLFSLGKRGSMRLLARIVPYWQLFFRLFWLIIVVFLIKKKTWENSQNLTYYRSKNRKITR